MDNPTRPGRDYETIQEVNLCRIISIDQTIFFNQSGFGSVILSSINLIEKQF